MEKNLVFFLKIFISLKKKNVGGGAPKPIIGLSIVHLTGNKNVARLETYAKLSGYIKILK